MNIFRHYLVISLASALLLFGPVASRADDASADAMSFEQAVDHLQAMEEAQTRLARMVIAMDLEPGMEPDAAQLEAFEREAELIMGPFVDTDHQQLASAVLGSDDASQLRSALGGMSADSLTMLLNSAAWMDVDVPSHNVPVLLELLDDRRSSLDTMPASQRELMQTFGDVELEQVMMQDSIATLTWQSVLALLPADTRADVVIAALDGEDYPLIRELLVDALDAGELADLELKIEIEWVLERVAEDRDTWLPLLVHVAGEDQMHLLVEQLMDLPQEQQIRALAKKPDAGLQADLERLGVWLIEQDADAVDPEWVDQLVSIALEMDSDASHRWLEGNFFDLPHHAVVAGRLVDSISWETDEDDDGLSPAFNLRLLHAAGRLGNDVDRILAAHEHDAAQMRGLVLDVLKDVDDDPVYSSWCDQWLAHGYLLATDASHSAPRMASDEDFPILSFCGDRLLELADGMNSIPTLDWLLDNMLARDDSQHTAVAAWQLASLDHDELREHAVWRLQDTEYWDSLDETYQQRLLDPEGYRAERAAGCRQTLDDSDLESLDF